SLTISIRQLALSKGDYSRLGALTCTATARCPPAHMHTCFLMQSGLPAHPDVACLRLTQVRNVTTKRECQLDEYRYVERLPKQ
ncbi:hypothetical protein HispidOSU_004742, partial [Sigmodon hispidus]